MLLLYDGNNFYLLLSIFLKLLCLVTFKIVLKIYINTIYTQNGKLKIMFDLVYLAYLGQSQCKQELVFTLSRDSKSFDSKYITVSHIPYLKHKTHTYR